jgi:hypothetical protein
VICELVTTFSGTDAVRSLLSEHRSGFIILAHTSCDNDTVLLPRRHSTHFLFFDVGFFRPRHSTTRPGLWAHPGRQRVYPYLAAAAYSLLPPLARFSPNPSDNWSLRDVHVSVVHPCLGHTMHMRK